MTHLVIFLHAFGPFQLVRLDRSTCSFGVEEMEGEKGKH